MRIRIFRINFLRIKSKEYKGRLISKSTVALLPEALCDYLLDKPGLLLDETAVFVWDRFRMLSTTSSIRRALVYKSCYKEPLDRMKPR